ncbi:uncharacterized protein LOC116166342 [Photinus pyralis]|uniref:uncharacterized protein LOC116166342 n=1 Tax=Photinus pyralis TaxID=7054 RepID=UPI0012674042|nr:uncharacterized protein LOC116166342 [Photinus pyralis]
MANKSSASAPSASENLSYYVVEFPDETELGSVPLSIIPSSWIGQTSENEYFCWWPHFRTEEQRRKAVINKTPAIHENSIRCKITIKYMTNTYENAVKKMQRLEDDDDLPICRTPTTNMRKTPSATVHDSSFTEVFTPPSSSSTTVLDETLKEEPNCCKDTKELLSQILSKLEILSQDVKFLIDIVQRSNTIIIPAENDEIAK